jgi:hypothetical protein
MKTTPARPQAPVAPASALQRQAAAATLAAAAVLSALAPAALAGWGSLVKLVDCPAKVQEVAAAHVEDGLIDEVRVKVVEGEKLYRVEIERPEFRDLELFLRPDGSAKETRSEMKLEAVPAAVRAAAVAATPEGGTLDDVFRRVAGDVTTFVIEYDRTDAADLHVFLSASGEILERIEETDD